MNRFAFLQREWPAVFEAVFVGKARAIVTLGNRAVHSIGLHPAQNGTIDVRHDCH